MRTNKLKIKLLKSTQKGQALLIVLVISTLTLILLLGIASRVSKGGVNIRRSSEYDRALASSESVINEIIKNVSSCSFNINDKTKYNEVDLSSCPQLSSYLINQSVDILGKNDETTVEVGRASPMSLNMGDVGSFNSGGSLTGVKIRCFQASNPNNLNSRAENKFIVSIVYADTVSNEYKILKGTSNCQTANSASNLERGNINFYDADTNAIKISPTLSPPFTLNNVKLIRFRLLDSSGADASVRLEMSAIKCTTSFVCSSLASTGSYDFLALGLSGLSSDSITRFNIPKGETSSMPPFFDFVFFGEDKN